MTRSSKSRTAKRARDRSPSAIAISTPPIRNNVVCNETVPLHDSRRGRPARLLVWDSTFTSDHEFYFRRPGRDGPGHPRGHAAARRDRSDELAAAGTGTMTDSQGRKNGAEIGGNSADWCDYSGTVDGQHVGMTVFCHPDNFRPSWFHARDYGFLAANAFGRAAFHKGEPSKVVVKPGESLRLRYGILIHAEDAANQPDLAAAYQDYVQQAGK